jgi:hypothetical protein
MMRNHVQMMMLMAVPPCPLDWEVLLLLHQRRLLLLQAQLLLALLQL